MSKLIIISDLHSSYSSWQVIKNIVNQDDEIAVAGDMFGTRYPSSASNYMPDEIKSEFISLPNKKHIVLGNCDDLNFFKNLPATLSFSFEGINFFIYHSHMPVKIPDTSQIIISGHTHIKDITKKEGRLFINPGSLSRPRDGALSYGIFSNHKITIFDIDGNELLKKRI